MDSVLATSRTVFSFLFIIAALFIVATPTNAFAATTPSQKGFVRISADRELYIDYQKAAPGRPTVVLLNGLTYETTSWDSFVRELQGDGIGILRYDPMGMGQTLLKYGTPKAAIHYRDQVVDLAKLMDALHLAQPVHILGLSYGGALAIEFGHEFPDRVASLIIMAPFVAPIAQQDKLIQMQIQQTRLMNPWNTASNDELYDYFLYWNIVSTYPMAEPSSVSNPYKLESIFRMVQGIRKFLAADVAKFQPNVGVNLMIARQDQYIENSVHDAYWNLLAPGTQTSRLYIQGSEHKIPEAVPHFSAQWVRRILDGDKTICCGRTFTGDASTGVVISSDKQEEIRIK